jgi:hypothetical protein
MTKTMLTGDVCVAKKLRGLKTTAFEPPDPVTKKDCPPSNAAEQHLPPMTGF